MTATQILIVCLVVFCCLIVWFTSRRLRRNRALRLVQTQSKKQVDVAVNQVMPTIEKVYPNLCLEKGQKLTGQYSADIWGKGIMVFDYQVSLRKSEKYPEIEAVEEKLNDAFQAVAEKQTVKSTFAPYPLYVITDSWYLDTTWHFNVAYLINTPTVSYVRDLRKIDLDKLTTDQNKKSY